MTHTVDEGPVPASHCGIMGVTKCNRGAIFMGIRTLFIAPYRGLKELATVLGKQQSDLELLIEEADLSAAIPVLNAYKDQGIQFIISRGGTAKIIKQYTDIPVVEVHLSGYDMLRTLTLIKDYKMKVHLIGFPNLCNGILSVANLLNIHLEYTMIEQEAEVKNAVKEAYENGAQVILGDTITVNTAESFGLQGMIMTSGREAVLEAFQQVKHLHWAVEQTKRNHSIYQALLNDINDGIAIFLESGEITYANSAFSQAVYSDKRPVIGTSIFQLPKEFGLDAFDFHPSHRDLVIQGESYHLTTDQFGHLGITYYYIKLSKVITDESSVKVSSDQAPNTSFAQFVTHSEQMKLLIGQAKSLSQTNEPIIISGEKGVGKTFLASTIHREREKGPHSFLHVTIVEESDHTVSEISSSLQQIEKGTVYIKGLELLSDPVQKNVWNLIEVNRGIRFIFGFDLDRHALETKLLDDFQDVNFLNIPPLRERTEDLEELIRIFIMQYNTRYGKQLVGIKEDFLQQFFSYDWPGNVTELKAVVKKMVNASEGDFIDYHLQRFLPVGTGKATSIDFTKTLEEIEKDIILQVLKEENMNQTAAAKRLGINRTTLWRKIK